MNDLLWPGCVRAAINLIAEYRTLTSISECPACRNYNVTSTVRLWPTTDIYAALATRRIFPIPSPSPSAAYFESGFISSTSPTDPNHFHWRHLPNSSPFSPAWSGGLHRGSTRLLS